MTTSTILRDNGLVTGHSPSTPVEVVLYTRQGCGLCDDAKWILELTARNAQIEIALSEIDIDDDPQQRALFGDDVPVVFVAGEKAFEHRVDPDEFVHRLKRAKKGAGGLLGLFRRKESRKEGGEEMTGLSKETCVPCRDGVPPLQGEELEVLTRELGGGWSVGENHHLTKEYTFGDFATALAFTNQIGEIAEAQGHHPDIHLAWGKVGVDIWTHKINGLTRSDFILAAKIDAI